MAISTECCEIVAMKIVDFQDAKKSPLGSSIADEIDSFGSMIEYICNKYEKASFILKVCGYMKFDAQMT